MPYATRGPNQFKGHFFGKEGELQQNIASGRFLCTAEIGWYFFHLPPGVPLENLVKFAWDIKFATCQEEVKYHMAVLADTRLYMNTLTLIILVKPVLGYSASKKHIPPGVPTPVWEISMYCLTSTVVNQVYYVLD